MSKPPRNPLLDLAGALVDAASSAAKSGAKAASSPAPKTKTETPAAAADSKPKPPPRRPRAKKGKGDEDEKDEKKKQSKQDGPKPTAEPDANKNKSATTAEILADMMTRNKVGEAAGGVLRKKTRLGKDESLLGKSLTKGWEKFKKFCSKPSNSPKSNMTQQQRQRVGAAAKKADVNPTSNPAAQQPTKAPGAEAEPPRRTPTP